MASDRGLSVEGRRRLCLYRRPSKRSDQMQGIPGRPAEIENILLGHPDIQDAAVIGEPHPEYGEVPVAYVVLRDKASLSSEAIIEYAAQGVAKYKRLARVVFTEMIPRSASGKILRRLVKNSPSR